VSAAKACTTDADCQALRTPGLPGEAEVYTNTYSECFVAVNRSVAPDAQQARVESWQRACETAEVAGICPDLPAPPVSCVGGSCALAYPYGSAGDGGGPGSMDGGASAVDAAREGGGG
jgi:hypothetical protein